MNNSTLFLQENETFRIEFDCAQDEIPVNVATEVLKLIYEGLNPKITYIEEGGSGAFTFKVNVNNQFIFWGLEV